MATATEVRVADAPDDLLRVYAVGMVDVGHDVVWSRPIVDLVLARLGQHATAAIPEVRKLFEGVTSNGDSARSECWHVLIRNRAMMATDGPDLLDDELCSWKNSPKKFRLIWPVPYSRNPGSTRLLDSTLTAQAAANQKGTR